MRNRSSTRAANDTTSFLSLSMSLRSLIRIVRAPSQTWFSRLLLVPQPAVERHSVTCKHQELPHQRLMLAVSSGHSSQLRSREMNSKDAPFARRTLHQYPSAVGVDNMFDYGEPKACSAHFAASGLVYSVKALEYSRQMSFEIPAPWSRTFITLHPVRFSFDNHCFTGFAVLDGVVYKIYHSLFQQREFMFARSPSSVLNSRLMSLALAFLPHALATASSTS